MDNVNYVDHRDKLHLSKDRYQYASIDISCRATWISLVRRRDSSYILISHTVKLEYNRNVSIKTGTERNFSVIESDYLFRGQWEWDIQNANGTNHELDECAVQIYWVVKLLFPPLPPTVPVGFPLKQGSTSPPLLLPESLALPAAEWISMRRSMSNA